MHYYGYECLVVPEGSSLMFSIFEGRKHYVNCFLLFHFIVIVFLLFLQVKIAYVNFVNHCYVDTEVEMKEIYASNHIWKLFENFLVDMARVSFTRC